MISKISEQFYNLFAPCCSKPCSKDSADHMYSTLAVTIGDVYGGLNGTSIKDRHQGPWFNV